jgi:hypothetical protein
MSRVAARITQADVARAIRAAKQTGAGCVEILPDGSIRISLSPSSTVSTPLERKEELEDSSEVIL